MAKFFNKTYTHAYKRGNTIWVKGTIEGYSHHRMSTGKKFSQANINFVEKNWESILQKYFDEQKTLEERSKVMSITELVEPTLASLQEIANVRTINKYRGIFEKHILPKFGDKKPDEISVSSCRLFQIDLREKSNLGYKTILNIRSAFSSIFKYAIDSEICEKNPILLVKAPSKNKFIHISEEGIATDHKGNSLDTINPFTLDDVQTLIAMSKGQFKNILILQFFTGMRIGEMSALLWSDIDWNNKTIHVQRSSKNDGTIGLPKNGQTRRVDILPPVLEALKEQFKATGLKNSFIFLTKHNDRYHAYDTFSDKWKNLLIRAGYDSRDFYQTRHTFASIMLQQGEELIWVSRVMLGHSEVSTTLKYYAKYIKDSSIRHAKFLDNFCTNNVQNENLKLESA